MKSIGQVIKEATKDLTGKQAKFVSEYVSNGNHGTNAALAAGYSKKTSYSIANENLKKPEIIRAKDKIMSAIAERIGLTDEMVLGKVMEGIRLPWDKENYSAIIKCCELGGKHLKLFTDKTESEVTLKSHEDWLDVIK